MGGKLLSTRDAAKQLNVTETALRNSRKTGKLNDIPAPDYQRAGSYMIGYLAEELELWKMREERLLSKGDNLPDCDICSSIFDDHFYLGEVSNG